MTVEEIIEFENDIANRFNNKEIRAPIHLEDGNIPFLIEIFKDVKKNDWILCNWRSHTKCLLKGVPKKELKQAILDGKSISLCFKEYKVLSSAIVGGNIPIGLGIAMDVKKKGGDDKVWVFVGEMTASIGIFHEALIYARNHKLPIIFCCEDNGKSVMTDTRKVWNNKLFYEPKEEGLVKSENLWYFKYNLKWPHAGSGTRIQF